ncbi:hypothetical protein G7048_19035 [Diaphorobacter sp. HDW4B]|nr:hypothetical protein [Diaphorobacter sp. HDW4B]QIL68910.1 hypothetical protein G7048_19035 [Diaphorobacter sp. HDW4B]
MLKKSLVIYAALAATRNPGDEIIIPAPYRPSFPTIVLANKGTPGNPTKAVHDRRESVPVAERPA